MHRQEGNREKASRNPSGKNYDFTMFLSCIITSRYITVKWLQRVYWLTSHEHRRFFRRAPTTLLLSTMNTWASQSTSFPKGVISCFHWTLFLFINWINRHLPQDPSVFCWQNGHIGHVELGCFVGPCQDMCLRYWRTGIHETESLPWLAPCKKRKR